MTSTPRESDGAFESSGVDLRSAALERVMRNYSAAVRRSARARGLNEADVDEVLQDVRVRLWKSNASGEKIESLGASYLQRVAISATIDLLRRRRARKEDSFEDVNNVYATPAVLRAPSPDRADNDALAHRLELALARLPRNRRLVVQLHLEGYSKEEIAGLTGWTESKVRNLLYRALDELRALLRSTSEADG